MAEKKGFDLAGLMKSVSKMNTREQIEYLPFELLDADPNNFYSIEGIEELADSIATVGLVHPLRVRQAGERYTITSGHRRRAAIKLLIDSGEDWSQGVPCVVDRGESEPEFAELKLIFANRQRQKTGAELSLEAERTNELFCRLREKGYEFPGRMQEHVAAALGVKASKLKRLHAIRSRSHEYVLDAFDKGEINESVAYELSQAPAELQKAIMVRMRHSGRPLTQLTAEAVETITDARNNMVNRGCHFNKNVRCAYVYDRVDEALKRRFSGSKIGNCQKGGCCHGCPALIDCERYCCKCEDERQAKQAEQAARQEALEKTAQNLAAKRQQAETEQAEENREAWRRICAAAQASGANLKWVLGQLFETDEDVEQVLRFARGEDPDPTCCALTLLDDELYALVDLLDCSVDFLMGRTDAPAVNRGDGEQRADDIRPYEADGESDAGQCPALREAAAWQTGEPSEEGWYACLGVWADIPERMLAYWRDGDWYEEKNSRRKLSDTTVLACYPLPELPDLEKLRKEVKT